MQLQAIIRYLCVSYIVSRVNGEIQVERTFDKADYVEGLPCSNGQYLNEIKVGSGNSKCACNEDHETFYMGLNESRVICNHLQSIMIRNQNVLQEGIKYYTVNETEEELLLCNKSKGELEYVKDLQVWDFQDTYQVIQGSIGMVTWRKHSEIEIDYEKEDFQIKFLSRPSWSGQLIKLVWKCKNENETIELLKFTGKIKYPLRKIIIPTSSQPLTPTEDRNSIRFNSIDSSSMAGIIVAVIIVVVLLTIINIVICFIGKRRRDLTLQQTVQGTTVANVHATAGCSNDYEKNKDPFVLNIGDLSPVYKRQEAFRSKRQIKSK